MLRICFAFAIHCHHADLRLPCGFPVDSLRLTLWMPCGFPVAALGLPYAHTKATQATHKPFKGAPVGMPRVSLRLPLESLRKP